jgi:hypothetical protein
MTPSEEQMYYALKWRIVAVRRHIVTCAVQLALTNKSVLKNRLTSMSLGLLKYFVKCDASCAMMALCGSIWAIVMQETTVRLAIMVVQDMEILVSALSIALAKD